MNPRLGVLSAFSCLGILGILPVLASARPGGFDGLTFTVWLTIWQILSALPLYLRERSQGTRGLFEAAGAGSTRAWTITVALSTGVMFGLSTYMYVVAAEKAGPVSMAIVLQAYPFMTMLAEAIFLKKRKTPAELAFTALMIAALVYLTTNGTFLLDDVSWWSVFALGIPLLWTAAHLLLKTQVLNRTTLTLNQVTLSRLLVSGVFLAGARARHRRPRRGARRARRFRPAAGGLHHGARLLHRADLLVPGHPQHRRVAGQRHRGAGAGGDHAGGACLRRRRRSRSPRCSPWPPSPSACTACSMPAARRGGGSPEPGPPAPPKRPETAAARRIRGSRRRPLDR